MSTTNRTEDDVVHQSQRKTMQTGRNKCHNPEGNQNDITVKHHEGYVWTNNPTLDYIRLKYTLLGKAGWWWIFEDALEEIARQLTSNNFVVLDEFMAPDNAETLAKELKRAYISGKLPDTKHSMVGCPKMEPGALAGGPAGNNLSYKLGAVRGDSVAWFSGDEKPCGWIQLPQYLKKIDTFVSELSEYVPELNGTSIRSRAMVTCYPGGGSHYIKHCDNVSTKSNGRKLTVLFYANTDWKPGDGGELNIFKPAAARQLDKNEEQGVKPETTTTPLLCSIPPILNRVIAFWSDERVPHEVVPTQKPRFAITTWFIDEVERKQATAAVAATSKDQRFFESERNRIAREIARFEAQYNAKAELVGTGTIDHNVNTLDKNVNLLDQNETTVLDQNETTMLDQNETTMLDQNETTMLDQNETTMLDQNVTTVDQNAAVDQYNKVKLGVAQLFGGSRSDESDVDSDDYLDAG